jgi:hypothetical protein
VIIVQEEFKQAFKEIVKRVHHEEQKAVVRCKMNERDIYARVQVVGKKVLKDRARISQY